MVLLTISGCPSPRARTSPAQASAVSSDWTVYVMSMCGVEKPRGCEEGVIVGEVHRQSKSRLSCAALMASS